MRRPQLGSVIALGMLVTYIGLTALGLWLETDQTNVRQWLPMVNCLAYVLAFPLVQLVMSWGPLYEAYEAGAVLFVIAVVANSYLWGYSIAWAVKWICRGRSATPC
jgi:hypothetical protein